MSLTFSYSPRGKLGEGFFPLQGPSREAKELVSLKQTKKETRKWLSIVRLFYLVSILSVVRGSAQQEMEINQSINQNFI